MHKIEAPGATQDNTFTEGDPAASVPATEVSASWLNAVQKEMVTAIQEAGITLKTAEEETGDQLAAAIVLIAQREADKRAISTIDGIPVITIQDEE